MKYSTEKTDNTRSFFKNRQEIAFYTVMKHNDGSNFTTLHLDNSVIESTTSAIVIYEGETKKYGIKRLKTHLQNKLDYDLANYVIPYLRRDLDSKSEMKSETIIFT